MSKEFKIRYLLFDILALYFTRSIWTRALSALRKKRKFNGFA